MPGRSDRLAEARRLARRWGRTAGFVGVTAGFVPLFERRMRAAADPEAVRDAWMAAWARVLLRVFAVTPVVEGRPAPRVRGGEPARRGRLVVANHRSAIDIGALYLATGGAMVSRADLAEWPLIGPGARAAGTLFVDRDLPQSGAMILRGIQRRLEAGETISLFPEGTTFDGDEVRPFHRGAFVAALAAKAEVVPVGIAYPSSANAAFVETSFRDHLLRLAEGAPTRVAVVVGAPLVPEPGERAQALADRAREAVGGLVGRARYLCGP